ncbi:MAG: heavy-metal-associated domain-containing protein [Alphaproteobacteria bacterium]|nr:MAG: cation transporter [Alphaproteobacteria bacterium]|tara:strand:+ start:1185 stop:1556 length:372 start_codon:yes stop_codon:yes gene_type:complete
MKKINILSLSILLFISTFSLANEQDHSNHDHMESNQIEIQAGSIDPNGTLMTVAVEGMVCDFCAQAIEKVFMKREEVAGITVNLDDQNVIISLKSEKDIENTIIEELFLNAGYNIQTIDRKKL